MYVDIYYDLLSLKYQVKCIKSRKEKKKKLAKLSKRKCEK